MLINTNALWYIYNKINMGYKWLFGKRTVEVHMNYVESITVREIWNILDFLYYMVNLMI